MPEQASDKQETKNTDEVALELMKFVAVTTGYGKGTPTAGFGGKGQQSSEQYADALLELFDRCRSIVAKPK
jgi:ATP:corrinoid adenosyltransferase